MMRQSVGMGAMQGNTTLSALKGSTITSVGELQGYINYNCRQKYYSSITEMCETFLTRGEDPVIRLWHSYSHCMQGNLTEAIKGYNTIKERKEVQLAAYIGLIFAHEQSAHQDEQEIENLKTFVEMEKGSAQNSAKLQAAMLYLHMSEFDEARSLLEDVS